MGHSAACTAPAHAPPPPSEGGAVLTLLHPDQIHADARTTNPGGDIIATRLPLSTLLYIWPGTNRHPPRDFVCFDASSGVWAVDELPVILVIEDEYAVQGIVEQALIDGGFATDILSSGEEALTLFRSGLKNYKALVADVSLKGRLSGWEVATQIRETDPQFPVIYMSGAHAEDWASKGVPNSIMLAKPFALAQLVTAVSQLLNAGKPPTAPA